MLPSTRGPFFPAPLMTFPFSVRASGEPCQIHPAFLPPAFPVRTPTGILALGPRGVYRTCKGRSFTIDAILGSEERRQDERVECEGTRRVGKTEARLRGTEGTPHYVTPLTCTASFRYQHPTLGDNRTGEWEQTEQDCGRANTCLHI